MGKAVWSFSQLQYPLEPKPISLAQGPVIEALALFSNPCGSIAVRGLASECRDHLKWCLSRTGLEGTSQHRSCSGPFSEPLTKVLFQPQPPPCLYFEKPSLPLRFPAVWRSNEKLALGSHETPKLGFPRQKGNPYVVVPSPIILPSLLREKAP